MAKKKTSKKKTSKKKASGTSLIVPPKVQAALDTMNPALRRVRDKIHSKMASLRDKATIIFYEVGVLVQDVCGDRGKYGDHALEALSKSLPNSANTLAYARQFVQKYSVADVKAATEAAEANGGEITQSHWVVLLQAKQKRTRNAVLKLIIDKQLTVREAAAEVQSREGRAGASSAQGRKPTPPKTVAAGIDQMVKYQRDVSARVQGWDEVVFQQLESRTAEEIDPELLERLESAKEDMSQTADTFVSLENKFQGAIQLLRRTLNTPATESPPPDMERPENANGNPGRRRGTKKKGRRPAAA